MTAALALALGLEPGALDELFAPAGGAPDPHWQLKLASYPAAAEPGRPGEPAAGAGVGPHTDSGWLTLLLQDEAGGWNAVVQPTLTARSLRRVDARRLEISVRAVDYDITAPETLTIVVPKAALLSQQANVTVLPHLVVYPTPGALRLGGTLCQNATVSTQICTNAR